MRPFRFLGLAAAGEPSGRDVLDTARRAESIGYHVLVLPDHLLQQHAPVPLLATVAAGTEKLRIGTFVLNVCLRHPAVLAQELASLDALSGGRLEIGLGGGWNQAEHDAIGLPFPPASDRISMLSEAIAVLDGCFGDGEFSFKGKHYKITNYDGHPKPVQRPRPPLFIGAGGRRALTLAAQQADTVGLAPRLTTGADGGLAVQARSITAAGTEEKIGWIREAAGNRFEKLELSTYSPAPVMVTDRARPAAQERADRINQQTGSELTADDILKSPHAFIGSIDGLADKFVELREQFGISSFMVGEIDQLAPVVERLAGT